MTGAALEVRGLRVDYETDDGRVAAVRGLDFSVAAGETLAVVGESGSGKSTALLAPFGLLPKAAKVSADEARLGDVDLLAASPAARRALLGRRAGFVFQDPRAALAPHLTVGRQLVDAIRAHEAVERAAARNRVLALFDDAGVDDPAARYDAFPHELSGGLCQRVGIAAALACRPDVVLADEPTTALDPRLQAEVLRLLRRAVAGRGLALVVVTHDLAVAAGLADSILVMKDGVAVARGPTAGMFERPPHPYVRELLDASRSLRAEPAS